MTTQSEPDWAALADAISGPVVLPGAPGYERLRRPAIARFHGSRPRAVVMCRTPADVAQTLALARRHGLPAVPRSGGHCFAGRSSTDGIVIDVSPMSSVEIAGGLVTAGAGARLGDLYAVLDARGVTVPAGCGPRVGIAGLTLGGGLGVLGRTHGLTSDHLAGARVVLAGGRVVDCDARRHADLLWALRGAGGGQFGVVTSLTFDTVEEPAAIRFEGSWPAAGHDALISSWQAWAPDVPDEVTANLTVVAEPGRPVEATVFGASLLGEAATRGLLREFAAATGASPAIV
ncbi:MAG TPA: FAD-binding oxidoreductase, partial [Streptosporangiaceae bacterium]|nr:FAD-binding oxidoreductase [Streptosporangiaceae bacterium]